MSVEKTFFQVNSHLDSIEKFALLNFMSKEFDLDNFFTITDLETLVTTGISSQGLFQNKKKMDLICCDLSDDSKFDPFLAHKIFDLLSAKGVVCIDGEVSAEELRQIFRDTLCPVLEIPSFSIFARCDGTRAISSMFYQVDIFRRRYFFENERKKNRRQTTELPLRVTVIVLTYNHELYIAKCLNSVLSQQGNFRMRIIIIDDASSDQTPLVVRKFIADRGNEHHEIEFHVNSQNCGVVKNLATSIHMAAGCDYLAFCEGDDFWSSDTRIQNHLDFLATHSECVMSFNTIELCSADGSSRRIHEEHTKLAPEVLNGNSLASCNWIGNFTACVYDGALVKIIPEQLFDMYTVDWMFNLYCSQFGKIGHVRNPLSVYRQHEGGEWSNRREWDKAVALRRLNNEYNKFLDFQYNEGFQKNKKLLFEWMFHNYLEKVDKFDLIIIDDVFPSKVSGFRYTEFTAYLRVFPNALALATGTSLLFLKEDPLNVLIRNYQLRYPELGNQVMDGSGVFPVQLGKLLYVNFLVNAYALLSVAEEAKVPFAFTLYPGGGFGLNDPECDVKLKRVFDSPCFLKVIVTQQITYDYLIVKKLCPIDKIEMIFGVVMPQNIFEAPIPKDKLRWGFDKKRLDICFMAHRYTPYGEDKGYGVFIKVANHLRSLYDDIYFHIVGPYDQQVMDVSPIRDRIQFHGILNPEKLNDFFKDIDIIMSPNISGKIFPGSFDGFPTASCTEGGVRGTAIFCTDEFNSAEGRFINDRDFVLIEHDLDHIINKVEYYYNNPEKLKAIGESGSRRIQHLYSYESQLQPRIKILRDLMECHFVFDDKKWRRLKPCTLESGTNPFTVVLTQMPSPIWKYLKKYSPELLKSFYRKFIKGHLGFKHV